LVQTQPEKKLIVTWLDEHSEVTEKKNRRQKYAQINNFIMFMVCDGAGDFTVAITDGDIVT
jgi:hypothetical protein